MAKPSADYAEKAARKAVPKTVPAWQREVDGISAFVQAKPRHLSNSGQAWFDSMRLYNLARLDVLLAHAPPGLSQGQARSRVREVKKALS